MVRGAKPLEERKEQTKQYVASVRHRAVKIKHPKGYGTDKERHIKRTWWEVRCDIHGTKTDSVGKKVLIVTAPKGRYARNVRGCPVCAGGGR